MSKIVEALKPAQDGIRELAIDELASVSGGMSISEFADKAVKTAAMVGAAVVATVLYLSLPPCD
jgi:hypothetical protein